MSRSLFVLFLLSSYLSSCRSTDPAKAEQINSQGLEMTNRSKYREALSCYQKAAAFKSITDSMRSIYLTNMAMSYQTLEQNDSAKYYFAKSAGFHRKKSCGYLTNMAHIALIEGDVETALAMLLDAHRFRPLNSTANNLLGLIYLGDYDQTYYDAQKALRYNLIAYNAFQDDISKYLLARNYYEINKTEKSLQMFRELHEKYPEEVSYLVTTIMMEQEMDNATEAELLMQKLKPLNSQKYDEIIAAAIQPHTHTIVWSK